ncbi:MFS transporter [Cellvibrio zantedeschiae]|uniref:MFS transporter n=1 Tax=Cellvibrio zantedeschiae TaxID=1237077 RepID=A0ABQ3ANZ1_9GAMM|nr:MFS transporter [Cellvibrio zantedeschiae]GGY62009.1 MFS transporter [Cellvibrio zantedeschiae]
MNTTASDDRLAKLSWRERICYGLGDTGFNFYWTNISAFLLFFYTEVFGITAAVAGSMMIIVKVINAFTDAGLGAIADRTQTRYGKYRPFLLWGALPLCFSGVLLYTTPDLGGQGKAIWAFCTYLLMITCYTFVSIPYSALSGVITANPAERDTINSARFVGGYLGAALVTWGTQKLVKLFGQGDDVLGWQLAMVFWGVAASTILITTFLNTRERVAAVATTQPKIMDDIKDLVSNVPWIAVFTLNLMVMILLTLRTSTTLYYFKYYVGKPDFSAQFLPIFMLSAVAGAFSAPFLLRFFEKKALLILLMLATGIFSVAFYFVPPDGIIYMVILQVLIGFALGVKPPLTFSMLADTADYNEWKRGRRATAMTFAAGVFSQKLGSVLATLFITAVFTALGYQANQEQTADSLKGIVLLMSFIPAALAFLSVGALVFYKLDKLTMTKIQEDLLARKTQV